MKKYLALWIYLSVVILCVIAVKYELIDGYVQLVIMFIGINVILSSSLNMINGYMGEFSCGHAGFMAVGAYITSVLNVGLFSSGVFSSQNVISPSLSIYVFPFTLLMGGIGAAIVGLLVAIPSFRTRGDYLAIITLAVNYIVKSSIENIQSIGGARGFMGMRKVVTAMENTIDLPWIMIFVLIFTGLTVWLIYRFVNSTLGKGMIAIREDEIAAEIMSINTRKIKIIAFMMSSGLAGIAGGLFAHAIGYINPGSFTIMKSTEVMVMVYLGGMGSLSGSVLSAVIFTILMELLRPLQVIKWIVIPLLLCILMLFRPEGLLGNRELADFFPKRKGRIGSAQ